MLGLSDHCDHDATLAEVNASHQTKDIPAAHPTFTAHIRHGFDVNLRSPSGAWLNCINFGCASPHHTHHLWSGSGSISTSPQLRDDFYFAALAGEKINVPPLQCLHVVFMFYCNVPRNMFVVLTLFSNDVTQSPILYILFVLRVGNPYPVFGVPLHRSASVDPGQDLPLNIQLPRQPLSRIQRPNMTKLNLHVSHRLSIFSIVIRVITKNPKKRI